MRRRPYLTARSWADTLPYIRHTFLAGAMLFVLFWGWDAIIDRAHFLDTVPLRFATAGVYAGVFVLMTRQPGVRWWTVPIYIGGILWASVSITIVGLQLSHGYEMIDGGLVIVILAIAFIGPHGGVSVPLVLLAATIPSAIVFGVLAAGWDFPGLPDAGIATGSGVMQLGAAVIAIILARVDTLRERELFHEHWSLTRLATTDPLTGIANRRQLEADFDREVARHHRHGCGMAILMIDIDYFKQVNDTYGHGVGDEVLCGMVARWRRTLREIDHLGRIGGEEFIVLLPETTAEMARKVAERLRTVSAASPLMTSAGTVPATVSIGCAPVPGGRTSLERAIREADRALYQAKNGGRNQVAAADKGRKLLGGKRKRRLRIVEAA
jgi:diguanylate cyclase (GGDEF)-like protein